MAGGATSGTVNEDAVEVEDDQKSLGLLEDGRGNASDMCSVDIRWNWARFDIDERVIMLASGCRTRGPGRRCFTGIRLLRS